MTVTTRQKIKENDVMCSGNLEKHSFLLAAASQKRIYGDSI